MEGRVEGWNGGKGRRVLTKGKYTGGRNKGKYTGGRYKSGTLEVVCAWEVVGSDAPGRLASPWAWRLR